MAYCGCYSSDTFKIDFYFPLTTGIIIDAGGQSDGEIREFSVSAGQDSQRYRKDIQWQSQKDSPQGKEQVPRQEGFKQDIPLA